MGKAEQTRINIISKAAILFNQRGYSGISLTDIMQATDLEKGGIYNHFKSKDEIALAAFDYAYAQQSEYYAAAMREWRGQPRRQLKAIIDVFTEAYDDPAIAGGCVIMNTAIESDNAHPELKKRAAAAMEDWHNLIQRIIAKGIAKCQFRPDVDPAVAASLIIASLEGGQMMSRLHNDPIHGQRVAEYLHRYIEQTIFM